MHRSFSPLDNKIFNDLSQLLIYKNSHQRKQRKFVRGGGWSFIEDENDVPKRVVHKNFTGGSDQISQWNRKAFPAAIGQTPDVGESFNDQLKKLDIQWEHKHKKSVTKRTKKTQPEEEPKSFQVKAMGQPQIKSERPNLKNFNALRTYYNQKMKEGRQQHLRKSEPKMESKPPIEHQISAPPTVAIENNGVLIKDEQCFDTSDPAIEALITSEVQKLIQGRSLGDPDQFIEDNYDYIAHTIGICACTRCTCGQCRCDALTIKLQLRSQFQSTYSKQFAKTSENDRLKGPTLSQPFYDSLSHLHHNLCSVHNQYETTNNALLNGSGLRDQTISQKPQPKDQKDLPLLSRTSYGLQFQNWRTYNDNLTFKQPRHVSVLQDMPFMGQSTYSNHYNRQIRTTQTSRQISPIKEIKELQQHIPIQKLYPDANRTSYNEHYQGEPTVSHRSPVKYWSQLEKYVGNPPFQSQFVTVNKHDYQGQVKLICPTKSKQNTNKEKVIMIMKQALK